MELGDLPAPHQTVITRFLEQATAALGPDLASIVLFGSAAEGRLRVTSDVNLILVLTRFEPARIAEVREGYRTARATVNLQLMFLLDTEVPSAAEVFAVKFADIKARHRILHGPDPFVSLSISPHAVRHGVRQNLMNLKIRLRERYALVSLREDRLAVVLAESAASLRTCAAAILQLEGAPASCPKEALQQVVKELNENAFQDLLSKITEARSLGSLPHGEAERCFLKLIELTNAIQRRAELLPTGAQG